MSSAQEGAEARGGVPSGEFAEWNEQMVLRYDIERYYERSHPLIRWVERRRLDALVDLAEPRAGDRVLEVGCGAGHVLDRFAAFDRTGVDLSTTMIARARRRLGPGVPLHQADAEQLPFDDASFDVVLCTEVLEHTRNPDRVVRELMRVARPGARVVVSIPNEVNIDRAKRALRRVPGLRRVLGTLADEGNEWHLHQFDRRFLDRITRDHARIDRMRAIPTRLIPLRWAARLSAP